MNDPLQCRALLRILEDDLSQLRAVQLQIALQDTGAEVARNRPPGIRAGYDRFSAQHIAVNPIRAELHELLEHELFATGHAAGEGYDLHRCYKILLGL